MKAHLRPWYGHRWRTVIRPEVLRRAGSECERCGIGDRAMCLKSALEVAHLDSDPANRDWINLACMCHTCHRRHDYRAWSRAFKLYRAELRMLSAAVADTFRELLLVMAADSTDPYQFQGADNDGLLRVLWPAGIPAKVEAAIAPTPAALEEFFELPMETSTAYDFGPRVTGDHLIKVKYLEAL